MTTELFVDQIAPAQWNPRQTRDGTQMAELAESIAAHGIIEPLVVRPAAEEDKYELICGTRRLEAATRLKMTSVPVTVRSADDTEAQQIALIENVQSENLHPLDEGVAYASMHEDGRQGLTSLAKAVGKTVRHLTKRIALTRLTTPVLQAFSENRIRLAHAERLCLVPKTMQEVALKECFYPLFRNEKLLEPAPIADLDMWIAQNVKVAVNGPTIETYFPEIETPEAVPTMVALSESFHAGADLGNKKHGLVNGGSWQEIRTKKDHCENVVDGVVVHGGPVRTVKCCVKKGCPKHRPVKTQAQRSTAAAATKKAGKPQWEIDQERRVAEEKAWEANLETLWPAFAVHVKALPVTVDLVALAISEWRLKNVTPLLDGQKLTQATLGQALAISIVLSHSTYDRQAFAKSTKPFGFKMPPKPAAPKPAAEKKVSTKGAKAQTKAKTKGAKTKATKKKSTR